MIYRIAHITDVHIKYDDNKNYVIFSKLLKDVHHNNCDHVVITGDISDYSYKRDFEIIRRKLDEFGLLDPERLSVVPGNHDIFGGPSPHLASFNYPQHCRYLDYDKMEITFFDQFKETFRNSRRSPGIFPYLKTLNDSVIIAGLNSVAEYSWKKNCLGTNGEVSSGQMNFLKEMFKETETEGKLKVILIHHYFNKPDHNPDFPENGLWLKTEQWKMKLHNRSKLLKLFKELKIDLVLHGHSHVTEMYQLKNITFLNSSGCTIPFTNEGRREYHIIEFDTEKKTFTVRKSEIK